MMDQPGRHAEFFCGGGAAFINITVTFPINKAMFRQQLHGISSFRAIGQLQKEGIRNLYRGLLPPLLQKTSSLAVMFGSFYRFQRFLEEKNGVHSKYVYITIAAIFAGCLETMFTPFERVQTLMQDKKYHNKFKNTLHAFKEVRIHGYREYYRGISTILLRNAPSNVLFFCGREYFRDNFTKVGDEGSVKLFKDFVSGAVLGAMISTIFYPVNVVKTRMQSHLGGEYMTSWKTFQILWKDRNGSIRKVFRGCHLNYTRSFLSWGVINASFDLLMKTFFNKSTRL
ncbi:hypothetical protein LOTGIDRAFT_179792 [Lottia gigantea]|uniref:Solute carrier family 25 member 51 n=1 Tax=Lottia gigantea TaxID=225164 RepID=V3ZG67_LOTGI|nr:hypothetical protein LOTGIDRAFT_179792 [Lottia gigantea]ESO83147.1 hypothetical protein LOTGIDRAFT_179792 [Lottia gigantea]